MHNKQVVRCCSYTKTTTPKIKKELTTLQEAEVRRRTMARKKAMDYQTKVLRLHLKPQKPIKDRQDVDIQTDVYLEEIYEEPESQKFQTLGAQAELNPELFSNIDPGIDASTQVDDKDLVDLETKLTITAETLIANVYREAMHELLYEDELDVKDRHQRMVYVKYIIQKKEMEKLEHEVKKVEKVQVDHTFQFYKNCNKIKSAKSTNFITDEIINDFTINHRTKTGPTEVESPELVVWLKEELQVESDELLKDIIGDLVQRRLDVHKEITKVKNI